MVSLVILASVYGLKGGAHRWSWVHACNLLKLSLRSWLAWAFVYNVFVLWWWVVLLRQAIPQRAVVCTLHMQVPIFVDHI